MADTEDAGSGATCLLGGAHDEKEHDMLNLLLRIRRLRGDARAARSGPQAMGRRFGQRAAHRVVRRIFR